MYLRVVNVSYETHFITVADCRAAGFSDGLDAKSVSEDGCGILGGSNSISFFSEDGLIDIKRQDSLSVEIPHDNSITPPQESILTATKLQLEMTTKIRVDWKRRAWTGY